MSKRYLIPTPILPQTDTANAYEDVRIIPDTINFSLPKDLFFDGTHTWVTNQGSTNIHRIDMSVSPPVLVATINLVSAGATQSLDITGDATHIFVTTNSDGLLIIIDKSTNTVVGIGDATGGAGNSATAIATDSVDSIFLVSKNGAAGDIYLFSKSGVIAGFPIPVPPTTTNPIADPLVDIEDMAFGGSELFLVIGSGNLIYKIDQTLLTVLDSYNPGVPQGYVHYDFGSVWTTTLGSNILYRYDPTSLAATPIATVALGDYANDLTSDGSTIWVGDKFDHVMRVSTGLGTEAFLTTVKVPATTNGSGVQGIIFDGTFVWTADVVDNKLFKVSTGLGTELYVGDFYNTLHTKFAQNSVRFNDPDTKNNLVSTRNNQSFTNPGLIGAVNLSSDTSSVAPGATANYAAIGGGDRNSVTGVYGAVPGGFNNIAGPNSIAAGVGCTAGTNAVAFGSGSTAGNTAAAFCEGSATGFGSLAVGTSQATADFAVAVGDSGVASRYAQQAWGNGTATSQASLYQVFGTSISGAPVNLVDQNSSEMLLENGKAYALVILVAAREPTLFTRTLFKHTVIAGCEGGVITIDADNIDLDDPVMTGWTILITTDGANHLRITFTGSGGVDVSAATRIDFVEVV